MKFWSRYIIQLVPVERVILNSYQSRVLCKQSNILNFHLSKVFFCRYFIHTFSYDISRHPFILLSLSITLHTTYILLYILLYILHTTYIQFSGTSMRWYNCCICFSQILFCLLALRSWHPLPVGSGDIKMESQRWITVECGSELRTTINIITMATCWCNICLTCIWAFTWTGRFPLALFLSTDTSLSVVLLRASLNHPFYLCLQVERNPGGAQIEPRCGAQVEPRCGAQMCSPCGAQVWSPGVYLHLVSTFISDWCILNLSDHTLKINYKYKTSLYLFATIIHESKNIQKMNKAADKYFCVLNFSDNWKDHELPLVECKSIKALGSARRTAIQSHRFMFCGFSLITFNFIFVASLNTEPRAWRLNKQWCHVETSLNKTRVGWRDPPADGFWSKAGGEGG